MEIFNIGPLELLFILVIALIILGPEDMVKTGKQLSIWIKKVIRSPFWSSLVDTTQEIKKFPKKFIEDTGLDEDFKEISKVKKSISTKEILPKGLAVDLAGESKKKTQAQPIPPQKDTPDLSPQDNPKQTMDGETPQPQENQETEPVFSGETELAVDIEPDTETTDPIQQDPAGP